MKLMKRALALLLCFLILTNSGPLSAFATEGATENNIVTEETNPPAEESEACEVCGGTDAHAEGCTYNTLQILTEEEPVACETCGNVGCESTHNAWCAICKVDACGKTHTACDKCAAVDCTSTHEAWCDTCKKDVCGVDHTTPAADNGDTPDEEVTGCAECREAEGHTVTCSQYVAPVAKCEHCQVELTEGAVHAETCPTLCTCEPVEGVHQEKCKFYVAPVEKCEHCQVELTEGATHKDDCLTNCTCTLENGVHLETCKLYEAPVAEIDENAPKVNDIIWIKKGAVVYKSTEDTEGYAIQLSYKIEITEIQTIGETTWYKFDFADWSAIIGSIFLNDYEWVKADGTSIEEPTDETACNCGENAPENLAEHDDSCPRKQYIKTLFDGKTAEEIYAAWDSYDEATQTDILNMLEEYDNSKYEELKYMIEGADDSSGLDIVYENYSGSANNGVSARILAPEGSFPEGTSVSISDAEVDESVVASLVSDEILGIVAVDIDFGGVDPTTDVMVSLNIPADDVPSSANKVFVVHFGDNGPEVVGEKYLNTADSGETVSFQTNSFSSYAAVFVNGKYNAQKMSSVLSGNSRYQVATFNVDLFDYDPAKMNTALNNATSDGNGFHFTGYNIAGMGSNNGINNSASTHAKQGILQNSLVNGLPVFNFLNGTNAGVTTGQILFSDSYTVDGKTVYNNIPFEFIYDSQTGYYEYKSSANHAQLNAAKNKIELYADSLSTENNYVTTLDLSTAGGMNDFGSVTATASSFKATASSGSGADDRLDPYVSFTVNNVAANDVGQIYVKAKIPASVGTNVFQIFFNSATEANTYMHEYTANGDWIEFVVDTSNISNWSGTISSIRIDLFDEYKGNLDNSQSYTVEIAQISLIKKNYDAYATRGGFYPFSEIQDSYPGNNYGFNYSTWESLFLNDSLTMARASRSIFNPAPSAETLRYEELAFGTVIEFDFYLPVNATGLDGEDLTYYFNGDDDLWVFVDNELVLDIGGGHGAVTGKVNFSQGTWNVENAVAVTGYNSGADASYAPKSGTLSTQLNSAGKHTMKIFYLERGGSVSNCFMKFNLPRTPQGSVVVSKEVAEKNNANTSALMDAEFEFQISIQNNGSGDYQEVTPLANANYFVVGSDGNSVAGKTDANGKFKLKHGQNAYFNIDENYKVTVTETKLDLKDHAWISTTVNGTSDSTLTQLTADGTEIHFAFVNTYERLFGNLKITKTGISELDHNAKESQSTIYVISGTSNNGESLYLEVVIVGNGEKLVKDIPTGTYTVTEKADWSWRYEPETNGHSVTVVGGETAATAFENERTDKYWLSGDCYAENWWGGSNGNVTRKEDEE